MNYFLLVICYIFLLGFTTVTSELPVSWQTKLILDGLAILFLSAVFALLDNYLEKLDEKVEEAKIKRVFG